MSIYQAIWNADQSANGIPALRSSQEGQEDVGYVKVNEEINYSNSAELRVLTEVAIPPAKRESYDLCRALFNNYNLPEHAREHDTPHEREERHLFVEAIKNSAPMQVAREYISQRTGTRMDDERWHTVLIDHWFRRFEQGGDPELSGFEHVIVGEQEKGKVQGYHFWYKYYLDDGFAQKVADEHAFKGMPSDQIAFTRTHMDKCQEFFPECVTIGFKWNAPDYQAQQIRPLFKKIGGFFVGCSVEGLMAMGTVRAHVGADAPRIAEIEGAKYDLKMFLSRNRRHIRTFYPVFKGASDPSYCGSPPDDGATPAEVRILAALVNPTGSDPGKECVSLINTGATPVTLEDWYLQDRNQRRTDLSQVKLDPGHPHTLILDGSGVQLSNGGGRIELWRGTSRIHRVEYSRRQAKSENRTLIFS